MKIIVTSIFVEDQERALEHPLLIGTITDIFELRHYL
jgi:hypothetical protein